MASCSSETAERQCTARASQSTRSAAASTIRAERTRRRTGSRMERNSTVPTTADGRSGEKTK